MTDNVIRVLIVDDHAVVRRGLRAFLSVLPDMDIVAEAADGKDALDFLADAARGSGPPDVVLMDLMMPRCDGTEATAQITSRYPGIKVIAMTSFSESERVYGVLRAGASGYVLKDAEADEIADAIRAVYRGEMPLDPAIARKVTEVITDDGRAAASLTEREREVLILVAHGDSNEVIADRLSISERTARAHVSSVLSKLGFGSRTQAAVWAIRQGLVDAG